MEDWLTTYDAARLADYDPDYIRKLVRGKKVIARKWGQSWQIHRDSLLEYIKKSEESGQKRGPKKLTNPDDSI